MSKYSIVKVRDLNQDILETLLSPNAFDIRVSHPDAEGFKYGIVEYLNLPIDLLKNETPVYSAEEIKQILATDPIWSDTAPFPEVPPLRPKITNLSLPVVNTEVSHAFGDGFSRFMLRSRSKTDIKIAFRVGESGTDYFTLKAGAVLTLPDVDFEFGEITFDTIYLQSDKVSVVEIMELYI